MSYIAVGLDKELYKTSDKIIMRKTDDNKFIIKYQSNFTYQYREIEIADLSNILYPSGMSYLNCVITNNEYNINKSYFNIIEYKKLSIIDTNGKEKMLYSD